MKDEGLGVGGGREGPSPRHKPSKGDGEGRRTGEEDSPATPSSKSVLEWVLEPKSPTRGAHIPQGWACTVPFLPLPPRLTYWLGGAHGVHGLRGTRCGVPQMSVTVLAQPEV